MGLCQARVSLQCRMALFNRLVVAALVKADTRQATPGKWVRAIDRESRFETTPRRLALAVFEVIKAKAIVSDVVVFRYRQRMAEKGFGVSPNLNLKVSEDRAERQRQHH